MLAKERRDSIHNMVDKLGAITTADLAMRLSVSIETIRRDVIALEQKGLLQRVHGGIVKKDEVTQFEQLQQRNMRYFAQKKELAHTAMQFISEGDTLWVDNGSTALAVAEAIREKFSRLTIVTCSTDVLDALKNHSGIRIILCGGYYINGESMLSGSLALNMLSYICIPKAFIFPSALSLKYGICSNLNEEHLIQSYIVQRAQEIFVLADSSKFERQAMLKICDLHQSYHYITDSSISIELKRLYSENGVNLITE